MDALIVYTNAVNYQIFSQIDYIDLCVGPCPSPVAWTSLGEKVAELWADVFCLGGVLFRRVARRLVQIEAVHYLLPLSFVGGIKVLQKL